MMTDRARLSKLQTYTSTTTPGSTFQGSKDFPPALINSLKKYDPVGLLFGTTPIPTTSTSTSTSTPSASNHSKQILPHHLQNKRILTCSGADDKLVPYHCSEPFLQFLKNATAVGGYYEEGNVYVEDKVYAGVGHAFSEEMFRDTVRFVNDTLKAKEGELVNLSKI